MPALFACRGLAEANEQGWVAFGTQNSKNDSSCVACRLPRRNALNESSSLRRACHLSIRGFSHSGQHGVRAAFDWAGRGCRRRVRRIPSGAECGKASTTRLHGQTVHTSISNPLRSVGQSINTGSSPLGGVRWMLRLAQHHRWPWLRMTACWSEFLRIRLREGVANISFAPLGVLRLGGDPFQGFETTAT